MSDFQVIPVEPSGIDGNDNPVYCEVGWQKWEPALKKFVFTPRQAPPNTTEKG